MKNKKKEGWGIFLRVLLGLLLLGGVVFLILRPFIDPPDYKAMIDAIEKNDMEQLETLLESHADPNIHFPYSKLYEFFKCTPLQRAAEMGNKEAVQLLLKYNADANYTPYGAERSALMYVTHYRPDLEIVKLLVENGANVNYRVDMKGFKESIEKDALTCKNTEVLDYLLKNGMQLNDDFWVIVCGNGMNKDYLPIYQYFIDSPDFDVDCTVGLHSYMRSCPERCVDEILRYLIKNGADIYAVPDGEEFSTVDMLRNNNQSEIADHLEEIYKDSGIMS